MDSLPIHDTAALAAEGALGTAQAAAWLGVSRSRLYELIAADAIPTCRVGRRRLVPVAALRAYLASRLEAERCGTDAAEPRPAA